MEFIMGLIDLVAALYVFFMFVWVCKQPMGARGKLLVGLDILLIGCLWFIHVDLALYGWVLYLWMVHAVLTNSKWARRRYYFSQWIKGRFGRH